MSAWVEFQKFIVFGLIGLLIECVFTGIEAFIKGDKYGKVSTCLGMLPIYSTAGLLLETIQFTLHWNLFLQALVYMSVIYGVEASFGIVYKKIFGYLFWDYTGSGGSVFGYINLYYAPFWYILSLGFPLASYGLHKFIYFLNVVQ